MWVLLVSMCVIDLNLEGFIEERGAKGKRKKKERIGRKNTHNVKYHGVITRVI